MKRIMAMVMALVVLVGTAYADVNVWEGEDGNVTLVATKDGYRISISHKDDAYTYCVYELEDGYTYECGAYDTTMYSIVLDGFVWYMPSFQIMEEVVEELEGM